MSIPVVGGTGSTVQAALLSPGETVLTEEEWEHVEREIECYPFLYAPVSRGDLIGFAVYSRRNLPDPSGCMYRGGIRQYGVSAVFLGEDRNLF